MVHTNGGGRSVWTCNLSDRRRALPQDLALGETPYIQHAQRKSHGYSGWRSSQHGFSFASRKAGGDRRYRCCGLGHSPERVISERDLLAIYESESQIHDFRPDFGRIASLDAFAVIISAPSGAVDYVYRFFAPRQGIPEDPVTGSANCTLVPYWACAPWPLRAGCKAAFNSPRRPSLRVAR